MIVRKYQASDADAVMHIWRTLLPDASFYNQPEFALPRKLAVDDLLFVAESKGAVIGTVMAGYDGHRGWLYSVAVVEAERRNGIGARLINHALVELAALGCVKVNLQVRTDNHEVTRFYEALGFTREPRISMGKRLDSGAAARRHEDASS